MKRFAYVVVLLVVFGAASIAVFRVDPSLKYEIEDPAYRFIGRQIFVKRGPLDTAYLGTSRIWTAVDTKRINEAHPDQRSVNLGSNWFGRHARLVIVRDLLKSRPPRRLVLEVVHLEPTAEHPYSAALGYPEEVPMDQFARKWGPGTRAKNFREGVSYFFAYELGQAVKSYYLLYRRLTGSYMAEAPTYLDQRFGHHRVEISAEAQQTYWDTIADDPPRYVPYDEKTSTPGEELDEIARLCREANVDLWFLFLPERNGPLLGPEHRARLSRLGEIADVSVDDLFDHRLWRDNGHFNVDGVEILTTRVLGSRLYREP